MSTGESEFLHSLETEVEAELAMVEASHPEELYDKPIDQWLFDPMEVERERVQLRNELDAIKALEHDAERDPAP